MFNINNVHRIREIRGMTWKTLAEKIGMSENGIRDGFNQRKLALKTIEKVAETLDIDSSYFFQEENIHRVEDIIHNYGIHIKQESNGNFNNQSASGGKDYQALEATIAGMKNEVKLLKEIIRKHESWEEDYKLHINMLENIITECKEKLNKK